MQEVMKKYKQNRYNPNLKVHPRDKDKNNPTANQGEETEDTVNTEKYSEVYQMYVNKSYTQEGQEVKEEQDRYINGGRVATPKGCNKYRVKEKGWNVLKFKTTRIK